MATPIPAFPRQGGRESPENKRPASTDLGAALLTGFLYVLCFPKWNLGFLAWVVFTPLFLSVETENKKKSFGIFWLAGFVASLGMVYWIYPTCRAANVDPFTSALAPSALAAYLALYWGAFGLLRSWTSHRVGPWHPVFLAAAWTTLEWLRGHLFTGFPWLPLAYSQWSYPELLGTAEVGGFYTISFAIVLFNALLAQLLVDRRTKRWNWSERLYPSGALLLAFAFATLFFARKTPSSSTPPVRVAVVQGNIDQYKKWDQAYESEVKDIYSRLTKEASLASPELIVWPETAVPGWIPNEPIYVMWLQKLARESSSHLLAGAASHRQGEDYNAAFLFSPAGEIVGEYRKRHLVPFGEVIPFQPLLSKWVTVLNELGAMTKSDNWTVFKMEGTSVGQQPVTFGLNICFESIFPDLVSGFVRRGAAATINITNDGWFLETAAPEQHFIASIFRAVENRTWVVRAANTGISGFIDPYGRVRSRTKLMEQTVLHGEFHPIQRKTFYTRFGDIFAAACAAATLGFLGIIATRRARLKV